MQSTPAPERYLLRLLRCLITPAFTFALGGCGGGDLVLPGDLDPALIEVVQGNGQLGSAGSPLEDSLVVRLLDQAGNGIPDRQVTWLVSAGGGTATPVTDTTNQAGLASSEWTLGPAAGTNTLDAVISDVGSVTFTATAGGAGGSSPSASRSTVSADPTSIEVESGISTIRVTVRDAVGTPIAGAIVTLEASGAGNTLTQPSEATDRDGVAIGSLRSSVPGTKDVAATVNGSIRIGQTAQVSVGGAPAPQMELLEGDDQSAAPGAPVPIPPAVRVTNDLGQPVPGIEVTFVVTEGSGSVAGSSQTTDSEGIARVESWTLGSPGPNTLEARAGGVDGSPVVFDATASFPTVEVHHLVFLVPPEDVKEDEQFSVAVALVDVNGNVVPRTGIEIYVDVFREGNDVPSNTFVDGERFRDTENGVAVFNLRVTSEGRWRIRALSDELPELGPNGPEPFLFSNEFEVD